jgi:DNA-binding beta-propeller fold protein YncE
MTNVDSGTVCPSCESSVRLGGNFCEYCGRPLSPEQTYDQYETDSPEGLDSDYASESVLNAEAAPTWEGLKEDWFEPSIGPAPGAKAVSWKASLRERAGRSMWSLILWGGSPVLLLVVLVAAIARDNFRMDNSEAPLISQEESGNVDLGDVPGLAVPLDIISPFTGEEKTAVFETVSDLFVRPRGVTTANGNLYIVDPEQGALFVLDENGQQLAQVLHANRRFVEPVDVAADDAGNVYVLDAGEGGQVSIHSPIGEFIQVVPIGDRVADRSRGIDVDSLGRIWVALTPALAVAAFDTSGQELIRISTDFEGTDLQPVDVAFHSESSVYVSSAGNTAVMRFSLGGELLNLWPLVTANSVDGPHLSLDSEGNLYTTQPEQGGILRIAGDGADEMEAWVLPGEQPLRKLVGITSEGSGNLVVTDSENGSIYRVLVAR